MTLPRLFQSRLSASKLSMNEVKQGLKDWFETPVGQSVLDHEFAILSELLPRFFGYYLVHAGAVCKLPLDEISPVKRCFHLTPQGCSSVGSSLTCVKSSLTDLPFASGSLDVLILHHCLDMENNVHKVLREADRVLMPGGSLVVVGFNPWSSWGLWRLVTGRFRFGRSQAPWGCRFLSPYRLSDWLNLLDFEVEGCETAFYLPPVLNERWAQKVNSKPPVLGHFGAVYVLVGKKRVSLLTPIKPRWRATGKSFMPAPVVNIASAEVARRKSSGLGRRAQARNF